MKRRVSVFALVLLLAAAMVGCSGVAPSQPSTSSPAAGGADTSKEIVVKHQLGETPVTVNPQKVVVFDFGILDSLDKLGVPVTGVPQGNIPPYLSKYEDKQYANVGTLTEPDLEKISAVDPDLIIISSRQMAMYDQLSELAPTVYLGLDTSKYMASFKQNMETVGAIFGKQDAVAAELKRIDDEIAQVQSQVKATGKNALIILSNDKAVSAYGPGSRFGLIHDVLGFKPVDENIEVSNHGMNVSFEYIKEKNPDFLFVIDRGSVVSGGGAAAKETVENDLVKTTRAYQDGKIVYLDANYWYLSGGGLTSVSAMVSEIAESVK